MINGSLLRAKHHSHTSDLRRAVREQSLLFPSEGLEYSMYRDFVNYVSTEITHITWMVLCF